MKRRMLSLLIAAAVSLSLAGGPAAASFKDIKDNDVALAAATLQSFGIISGYEDGTFRPDEKLSRAQFCKLAVMAMGLGESADTYAAKTFFTDVRGGSWAAGYVNLAYKAGIVDGYGNGVFGAGDGVSYGQAATVLLRMLGYEASDIGDIWPEDFTSFASRIGLDAGLGLEAGDCLTRGDAALLLYRLLTLNDSGGRAYYSTLPSVGSTVDDAVITSTDGGYFTYRCRTGERTVRTDYAVSEDLKGLRGTVLLDEDGSSVGFVPDGGAYKDIIVSHAASDRLTDGYGNAYYIGSDKLILGKRAAYSYGDYWRELLIGGEARLYFDESGNAELLLYEGFDEPQVASQEAGVIVVSASAGRVSYIAGGEEAEAELASACGGDWGGRKGTLLFDSEGAAVGFIPDAGAYKDITVSSAKAAGLTAADGAYYRLEAGAQLYINGGLCEYADYWFELGEGGDVRLYYNEKGAINLVYAQGGSLAGGAAVAETDDAETELAGKLGIGRADYKIIKNGCAAASGDIARYDVGQYDGVTNTLVVSDVKLTGLIDDIAYSGGEASSLTLLGNTFEVLESALDTLAGFDEGDRATLLLTADKKIAAVYAPQSVSAAMRGILKLNGKSAEVRLASGITVAGSPRASGLEALDGCLVGVSADTEGRLVITALSSDVSGALDIGGKTLGSRKLAPGVKLYDWAGSGAVIEIELTDLDWTASLPADRISYAGLNSAGQVDAILLKDVTGDAYVYGLAAVGVVNAQDGLSSTNSVYVTNGDGASASGQTAYSLTSGSFYGIALRGDGRLAGYRSLTAVKNVPLSAFTSDGYVVAGGHTMKISEEVQVYDGRAKTWMTLEEAAAKYGSFTIYYDRPPAEGGKVRLIVAE